MYYSIYKGYDIKEYEVTQMKFNKKRFAIFIGIIFIFTLFSGIKIGEALGNKMFDKLNNEKIEKVEVEDNKDEEEVDEEKENKNNEDQDKEENNIEEGEKGKEEKEENEEEKEKESEKDTEEKNESEEETENKEKHVKKAYLTFDDGPSKNVTPQILDILREYDIKGTFFVTGRSAKRNKDILRRIDAEGHAIGNHSYSHDYKYLYSSVENFLNDMKKNEKLLKEILGDDFQVRLARLPGGSYGKERKAFNRAIKDKGYKSIDWNALTGDAEGNYIPEEKLIENLKSTSKGKDEIVILMHDLETKQTTASALPKIIEYLRNEGYEFHVLD